MMTREEFYADQPADKRDEGNYQAALWFREKFGIPESMPWLEAKALILKGMDTLLIELEFARN